MSVAGPLPCDAARNAPAFALRQGPICWAPCSAVAQAEASQTCDRLDDALSRAGQLTGEPVEVARRLVRDGYEPETAAMASVLVLGV